MSCRILFLYFQLQVRIMKVPRLLRDAPDRLPAAPYYGAHHVRLHQDPQREVDLAAGRVPHGAGQPAAAPEARLVMEEVGRRPPRLLLLLLSLLLLALRGAAALFSDGGRGRRGVGRRRGGGHLGRHGHAVVHRPVQRLTEYKYTLDT